MIVAPAVDLRRGRCVQWVGGRPEEERVSHPDPVGQARRWWDAGFRTLHVVDLDAALGEPRHNREVIRELRRATPARMQVGGGVRDEATASELLDAKVDRIIAGTRAVEEPGWLEALAESHPHRVMVAADVKHGVVVTRGWTYETGTGLAEFLRGLDRLPLAGVLCTDVSREGRMAGIDLNTVQEAVAATHHPVWISGGISTLEELRELAARGVAGTVIGMALYTGALPTTQTAKEFGE